ncbi:Rab21 [Symbiodinium natans]|uniref:Rab21 protein n=1 Tax=Symbiodinium natans TaxID=878477 RepID=A0A812RSV5_9DINO|nr:Rab21 [Symbiodinium natans]
MSGHEGPFKIVIGARLEVLHIGKLDCADCMPVPGYAGLLRDDKQACQASTQSAAYLTRYCSSEALRRILQISISQTVPKRASVEDHSWQERFHSLAPIYYRNADGALLVYDVTDLESFRRVAKWVEELQVMAGSSWLVPRGGTKCVLAIVGNKSDLQSQAPGSWSAGAVDVCTVKKAEAKVPKADAETYARIL